MGIKREACDKWFSDVIRLKANHTCECCHNQDRQMHCCHIYGRGAKSVRWSIDNALCMCSYCHRYFTENPIAFTNFLQVYLGKGHMEMLNEKWRVILKTNKLLRKEIALHYRREHKKMVDDVGYEPVSYN